MRSVPLSFLLTVFLALPFAPAAHAEISAEFKGWTFAVSGSAGGFANYTFCDKAPPVGDFYVACAGGPTAKNSTSFSSGLVPGHLTFEVKTAAAGWDVSGAVGWWSNASSSGSGSNGGFGFTKTDQRQNYVTFGKKDLGTFKVGRDFAIFGGEALSADMTVAGVGSGGYTGPGGNSTAGRIGLGYFFLDEDAQITYSSPKMSGFQIVLSVEQAWDIQGKKPLATVHESPAFEGKITFDLSGSMPMHFWISGWAQNSSTPGAGSKSITSAAGDVGVVVTLIPGLSITGSGYYGSGAGMFARGLYALADDLSTRNSAGAYGQVTYKISDVKLGVSYGASLLSLASGEVNPTLLKSNASIIGGLYYGFTPNVTLVAEWTNTMSKNQAGNSADDNNLALGALIFF
jgi:predicted porin